MEAPISYRPHPSFPRTREPGEGAGLGATIESAIAALPGIRRVKAQIGTDGVESLRVLVIPERSTTKTLADVQKVMHGMLGKPVDQARIQVIRTGPTAGTARRKLSSLSLDRSDEGFSVRAALELSGDVLLGETESPHGVLFERKAIAEAILKGAQELIEFPIQVQRVYVIADIDNHIAVVVLARGDEILVGSAVVRKDEPGAIARATLAALNRFAAPEVEEQLV